MQGYRIWIYLPLQNIKEDWYEYFIIQYLCQSHFHLRSFAILKGKIDQLIICPRRPHMATMIHSFYASSFRSKKPKAIFWHWIKQNATKHNIAIEEKWEKLLLRGTCNEGRCQSLSPQGCVAQWAKASEGSTPGEVVCLQLGYARLASLQLPLGIYSFHQQFCSLTSCVEMYSKPMFICEWGVKFSFVIWSH